MKWFDEEKELLHSFRWKNADSDHAIVAYDVNVKRVTIDKTNLFRLIWIYLWQDFIFPNPKYIGRVAGCVGRVGIILSIEAKIKIVC